MRSPLALSVLALLGLLVAPGEARAATPANAGDNCTTLGATQWAADNTGLLGCGLVTGNTAPPANVCATPGMCKWKSMSGGGSAPTVPSGTMCGLHIFEHVHPDYDYEIATIPCNGSVPSVFYPSGCPSGYSWSGGYNPTGGSGSGYYYGTCIKN